MSEKIIQWLSRLKATENDTQRQLFTKAVRVINNNVSGFSYSNEFGDIENDGYGKVTIRLPNGEKIETTREEMLTCIKVAGEKATGVILPKGQIVRPDRKIVCKNHIAKAVLENGEKWNGAIVLTLDKTIIPHCEFCGEEADWVVASWDEFKGQLSVDDD